VTAPRKASLRSAAALAALLALAACGGQEKKAPPGAAKKAAAAAKAAAAPTDQEKKPAAPEWAYSSVGKRDPFRSFFTELESSGKVLSTKCDGPLGRFEIEQLRLVAVVTGLEDPVAMVEAPGGVGYSVRRGACIGKNGGVVAAIRSGEVVVTEVAIRADGTRDKTQTSLRLPREAAMNLEEQP
jgi:type IV pilus assembly protein PilP